VQRGFNHVTVAEIARAAEIAEKTVFNYFPTKEDLVYWRLKAFEAQLLAAIRERPGGASALEAFGQFLTSQRGWLGEKDPQARERMVAIARMITDSPALIAREQQVFERFTTRWRRCSPRRPAPNPATSPAGWRPTRSWASTARS
jgi:AcrR family transcriptional regulator